MFNSTDMSIYAESSTAGIAPPPRNSMTATASLPRSRASTYCNRPLPPLPSTTTHKKRCVRPSSKHRLSHFPTPPPLLLPREQADALTLQDHTFLYILSNVDQYPVELLSLLPEHWRRNLLSALPPFRLYQLERTPIARNIDTDEMWEELSQQQDCVWGSYLKDKNRIHQTPSDRFGKERFDTPRVCFTNYLSHLIFNEMNRDYACKRITELLHAIHVDMLKPTVANGLICGHVSSLFMFQPPYYLIPFRCRNLTERELYWLLHGNRMLPASLELYTYNIEFSPLWNQDLISQGLMRRLFSKLSFLRIYNHAYRTYQLEDIVDAVTHSSQFKDPPSNMGSLKHLEVLRADDRDLTTLVPFFSAPRGYSNLTSITISMGRPVSYLQATRHLGPVIRHQLDTLQHLELQGFSCTITKNKIHMCDYMLFSSLVAFVLKPRFSSLTLDGFKDMPLKMVEMLLEANLRTVPSHKQVVTFRNVTVTSRGQVPFRDSLGDEFDSDSSDEDEGENQFCPASDSRCLEHKRVHFINSRIPMGLINWFQSVNGLYLNTLEFNKVEIEQDLYRGVLEIETGIDGVAWGCFSPRTRSQNSLKAKLLAHRQFECRLFIWEGVTTDTNYLSV